MLASITLFAAGAAASNRWWPSSSASDHHGGHRCKEIAGTYQWAEIVNSFEEELQPGTDVGGSESETCVGAVALLDVHEDCGWFLKRLRNDPYSSSRVPDDHSCISDNSGNGAELLKRTEEEFWTFPDDAIGGLRSYGRITFTVAAVPGFAGGAHRITGLMRKPNGCDLSFEGWRVDVPAAELTHCQAGYVNGVRTNVKRAARLTDSSTSSASVSDIRDALALIAKNIPDDWTESGTTTTTTTTSDSEARAPCDAIKGIYQVQLINNEVSDDEVGGTSNSPPNPSEVCSNMIGLVDIDAECGYTSKFVRPHGMRDGYLCIDDSGGWANTAIGPLETEFWCYLQDTADGRGIPEFSKFKFAVHPLANSNVRFLSGIYEYHTAPRGRIFVPDNQLGRAIGEGCDYAISGWRTGRTLGVTPCRDVFTPAPTPAPTVP